MYGHGSGVPQVLGAATGVTTAAVLPQTGMGSAIQVAVAMAAGLAAWAVVYIVSNKLSRRQR